MACPKWRYIPNSADYGAAQYTHTRAGVCQCEPPPPGRPWRCLAYECKTCDPQKTMLPGSIGEQLQRQAAYHHKD